MRVYFRDGILDRNQPFRYVIDAAAGVSMCEKNLAYIHRTDPDSSVYTNSSLALDGRYCWDEKRNECGLYLERNGRWRNAKDLTDRRMRSELGYRNLYLAGEFR